MASKKSHPKEPAREKGVPAMDEVPVCTPVTIDESQQLKAATRAVEHNPANRPAEHGIAALAALGMPEKEAIGVLTTKYWGTKGVKLGVSFMDSPSAELRDLILSHMNAWGEFSNVHFSWSQSSGEVRISRGAGGYWSYLGTDILSIPRNQPTMNLQGFTLSTPISEYKRVVRHETGHTLGCPHEHARKAIVNRLDPDKVIADFERTQGWSEQMIRQQILTPIEESSILTGGTGADETSIMAYQFPARLTKNGVAIPGGMDFSALDKKVIGDLYPMVVTPVPPAGGKVRVCIEFDPTTGKFTLVK